MKFVLLAALSLGCAIAAGGQNAVPEQTPLNLSHDLVRLGIADRNMSPDHPSLDARPLFQAALAYVKKNSIRFVTADQGDYYMLTPQDAEAYLRMTALVNVRLDLADSTIYFAHGFLQGFAIENCKGVELSNFRTDFLEPPYTHVQLASVNAAQQTFSYTTLTGWQDPVNFNGAMTPIGPPVLWAVALRNGNIVPGTSRMQVEQPIVEGTLRLVNSGAPWMQAATLSTLEPGDTIVVTERGGESLITASTSEAIAISHVTVHGSSAMAVQLTAVKHSTVDGVRVVPRPDSGLIASNADGIHFSLSGPDNHIRNSFVTRTLDDALAFDALDSATVTSQAGPRQLTVMRSFYRRFPNGSAVNFVDPVSAAEMAGATIVSQSPPYSDTPVLDGSVDLTFDRDLAAIAPGFGMVFAEPEARGAGSTIEDNEVGEVLFGRGIWIGGNEGVTVERNRIGHTSNGGIVVFEDTVAYPGPPAHDIHIRFNRLYGSLGPMASGSGSQTASGAVIVASTNNTFAFAPQPVNAEISIQSNQIVNSGRAGIWIGELQNGRTEDNTIDNWDRHPELPLFGVDPQTAALLQQDFTQPVAVHFSGVVDVQHNREYMDPPTVAISVTPASLVAGESATLTWSSTNADSCKASGAWSGVLPVNGSQSITSAVPGTLAYSISCSGWGGSANGAAYLTVAPAPPSVKLTSSATTAFVGQTMTLTWSSMNVSSCSASGAWSGARPINGSQSLTLTTSGIVEYRLSCTGVDGSATDSAVISVQVPSLSLTNVFYPNSTTISTSEGAPYADCDFWVKGAADCNKQTNFGYGPTKVVRLYVCLSGEVPIATCSQQPAVTGPLSSAMVDAIGNRIAAFAGSGIRLMIRFTYNFGPIGAGAMDAPVDVISGQIDQLAPALLRNKDLIFALEAGFIGTWGEWHDSTNGNDNAAAQKVVLDKELSYFGGVFPILVRQAANLVQYGEGLTPVPGLGMHDDYYASNSADAGAWATCVPTAGFCLTDDYTSDQFRAYGATISATSMFAGEFGTVYQPLQTCSALDSYSYTYHAQSIVLHPPATVATELENEGCASSFYNKVGTRIELEKAAITGSPTANGVLRFALTMANTGYGRVIRARPATLLITSQGQILARFPIAPANLDLTQLASSAAPVSQTFHFDVTLPATFPSFGSVSAVLLISDPAPSLIGQAAYALPLNSVDGNKRSIFDAVTGYNLLGTFNLE